MPFDGNGNFTVDQPAFTPSTTISSSATNSNNTDFADGLSNCVTKDGQSTPTAAIPLSNDGIVYASDPDTGLHRTAANTQALECGGTDIITVNTTSVTISTPITPVANDGSALGTSALEWSDLFLASGGVINFNAGDVSITHSANSLTFSGASVGYFFDNSVAISAGGLTVTAGSVSVPAGSITVAALNTGLFATKTQMEAATSTATAATPATTQNHPGVAKAWAQVQISGGTPSLLASYNIASIVDNGIGDVTLNFTTAFSSANYCAIAQFYGIDSSVSAGPAGNVKSQTASAARVQVLQATNSTNTTSISADYSFMLVAYGDQ